MSKECYYKILGVDKDATPLEIKRAYRKRARQWHPDVNEDKKGAEEKFKKIAEAHEVLKDPKRRAHYDKFGHGQQAGGRKSGAGNSQSHSQNGEHRYQNTSGFGDGFVYSKPFFEPRYWKTATVHSVLELIKQGMDIHERDFNGHIPSMVAFAHCINPAIIKTLIKQGADMQARNIDGLSAFMFACKNNGNAEIITTLIQQGADVHQCNDMGETALWYACLHNPNPEIVAILLDKGADINVRTIGGKTLLMGVVDSANPNSEILKILIERGVDVNATTKRGKTALMMASIMGHKESVRILIDNSADINARTTTGKTPLIFACGDVEKNDDKVIKTRPANPIIMEMLIHAGADVTMTDKQKQDAWHYIENDTVVKLQYPHVYWLLNDKRHQKPKSNLWTDILNMVDNLEKSQPKFHHQKHYYRQK